MRRRTPISSSSSSSSNVTTTTLLPSLTNGVNSSNDTLLAYTFTPFQNREQWLQVASESVNTPRFLLSANGELVFGSHNGGFNVVNPQYVLYNPNSYSSYELMTLREVLPSLYYRVIENLPTTKYIVSKQNKQFVRLIDHDPNFETMVYNYPPFANTHLEMVQRPSRYTKRGYTDVTDDVIQSQYVSFVDKNKNGNRNTSNRHITNSDCDDDYDDDERRDYHVDDTSEEIEQDRLYNEERNEALAKVKREIEDRVRTRYPLIDNVLKPFFNIDKRNSFFLYIELDYIFIGANVSFVSDNYTTSITKDNVNYCWRKSLLEMPSNPKDADEMLFFEIIADLTDYVGYYYKNIIHHESSSNYIEPRVSNTGITRRRRANNLPVVTSDHIQPTNTIQPTRRQQLSNDVIAPFRRREPVVVQPRTQLQPVSNTESGTTFKRRPHTFSSSSSPSPSPSSPSSQSQVEQLPIQVPVHSQRERRLAVPQTATTIQPQVVANNIPYRKRVYQYPIEQQK